ncbi:hypothetical protein [uncultured Caulobacter sp.]|jgi:hypothetical protein|uniref:hypothetical protein n=1 Tax=uncultured Caulobacter sp. TaxID=158749 RepID=UPI002619F065|nr:hypothetical protein [uncultured Caulobacter sp.]
MKSTVNSVGQPSRDEVLAKLGELVDGRIDRGQASAWASQWLAEDRIPGSKVTVTDIPAWNTLVSISGADTYGGDRPFLYDEDDFRDWALKLEAAPR